MVCSTTMLKAAALTDCHRYAPSIAAEPTWRPTVRRRGWNDPTQPPQRRRLAGSSRHCGLPWGRHHPLHGGIHRHMQKQTHPAPRPGPWPVETACARTSACVRSGWCGWQQPLAAPEPTTHGTRGELCAHKRAPHTTQCPREEKLAAPLSYARGDRVHCCAATGCDDQMIFDEFVIVNLTPSPRSQNHRDVRGLRRICGHASPTMHQHAPKRPTVGYGTRSGHSA